MSIDATPPIEEGIGGTLGITSNISNRRPKIVTYNKGLGVHFQGTWSSFPRDLEFISIRRRKDHHMNVMQGTWDSVKATSC